MSKILKHTNLKPNDIQEIITKMPSNLILYGNILLFIIIGIIIMLGYFVKYPDIIVSQAIVTTSIPPQKIYSKVTSKIDSIFVHNQQKIQPNQPLLILTSSADYESVYYLKTILDTLDIQGDISDFILKESTNWVLGDIEHYFSEFETNYLRYQLYKKLKPLSNDEFTDNKSVFELNNQLKELNLQHTIHGSELYIKRNKLQRSKQLFDKGIISALEFEKEQVEFLNAEGNLKEYDLQKSRLNSSISSARNKYKSTIIEKATNDVNLYKEALQSLQNLKRSIKDWELIFVLQSDISGNISFLDNWTSYQILKENSLIFTVIPDKPSQIIAKLKTPLKNSGKIKMGQKVIITLLNYPEEEFGSLIGYITSISSIPDDDGLYFIHVALPERLITTYHTEIEFKQEMTGSAEIITDDQRLLEKIFFQFKKKMRR